MRIKCFIIIFLLFSVSVSAQKSGCVEGDCVNGASVFVDDKGIRFEGDFQNGVKIGKGKQIDTEGNIYSGDWKNNLPNGKGTYKQTSGDKYTGYFKDGLYHGTGVLIYANKDRYTGEFKKDKRSGYGTMLYLSQRRLYVGKWSGDKPHGAGVNYTLSSAKSVKYAKGNLVSQ